MVHSDHHPQTLLRPFTDQTRRCLQRLVLIPALAGLVACTQPLPPSPTALPTLSAPTAVHTLAPSATPTATASPVPSATPTLTPTPTATVPTNTVVEFGQLPPGFSLTKYADAFAPTSLAFGPDGRLYVASANQVVYAFADTDGDHRAETRVTYAAGLPTPLGLLWVGDDLYISYTGNVDLVQDTNKDGISDRRVSVVANLPNKLHQNDGMVLGSDGYIYLGNGSTCDVCTEASQYSAAILRFKPNGTGLSVYASGFRNPYDLAYNAAGDLFATDNGRDKLGDDIPREELNFVQAGQNYGWPDCWFGNNDLACANTVQSVANFTAHSSADGLTFYEGDNFPPQYKDNAFVAIFGSYILPQIPHGVMRVQLTKTGDTYTSQTDWFLSLGTTGRPLDVTVGPDGGLYVADYEEGAVFRIVYGAP